MYIRNLKTIFDEEFKRRGVGKLTVKAQNKHIEKLTDNSGLFFFNILCYTKKNITRAISNSGDLSNLICK